MIQKIRTATIGALLVLGSVGVVAISTTSTASAVNVWGGCDGQSSQVCGATSGDSAQNLMKNVINTLLLVLGIIAVIMIVVGGIRYTLSGGDASSIKAAKDTVLYSVVGLVVAMLAYAIVNFVVDRFSGGGGGGGAGGTNQQQGAGGTPTTPTTPTPGGASINPNTEE